MCYHVEQSDINKRSTGFGGTCLSGKCQAAGILDTVKVHFYRPSDGLSTHIAYYRRGIQRICRLPSR